MSDSFLEPGQHAADRSTPVPRAHRTAGVNAALWALRIFTLLLSVMVIYTFVTQLHQ